MDFQVKNPITQLILEDHSTSTGKLVACFRKYEDDALLTDDGYLYDISLIKKSFPLKRKPYAHVMKVELVSQLFSILQKMMKKFPW